MAIKREKEREKKAHQGRRETACQDGKDEEEEEDVDDEEEMKRKKEKKSEIEQMKSVAVISPAWSVIPCFLAV